MNEIRTRTITLVLDDLDYDLIQAEFSHRQVRSRTIDPTGETIVPEGDSNLAGALVAEIVRDLHDYRDKAARRRKQDSQAQEEIQDAIRSGAWKAFRPDGSHELWCRGCMSFVLPASRDPGGPECYADHLGRDGEPCPMSGQSFPASS
jgi:hypothetical protein